MECAGCEHLLDSRFWLHAQEPREVVREVSSNVKNETEVNSISKQKQTEPDIPVCGFSVPIAPFTLPFKIQGVSSKNNEAGNWREY